MAELRLRAAAVADLHAILDYGIDMHGRAIAEGYLRGIDAVFARLRDFPRSGTPRTELKPGLRSMSYRRHRIFYEVDAERIVVVRVLHHSMDTVDCLD